MRANELGGRGSLTLATACVECQLNHVSLKGVTRAREQVTCQLIVLAKVKHVCRPRLMLDGKCLEGFAMQWQALGHAFEEPHAYDRRANGLSALG